MSNSQVGKVYENIINAIIELSKVDFEESGVDVSTLETLKKGWQDRLVESGVAKFPWEPEDAPPKGHIANPPTLLSNVGIPAQRQNLGQHQASSSTQPPYDSPNFKAEDIKNEPIKSEHNKADNVKNEPRVKNEPMPPGYGSASNGHSGLSSQYTAENRANKLIMEKFNTQAVNNPNSGQSALLMPGQQRPGLQLPGQSQPPQGAQQYQQPQNARPGPSQTDGAAETPLARWTAIVEESRESDGTAETPSRPDLDAQLAQYIMERGKSLDDGGLMVTMTEDKAKRRSRKRKLAALVVGNPDAGPASIQAVLANGGAIPSRSGVSGHDGGDDLGDDEVADEDAINSDLDDPADELGDDDDDDESGDMMLCMYEKVQRVKNKWKCTLKDGVLTVDRKEYVFHKSTGEYEW